MDIASEKKAIRSLARAAVRSLSPKRREEQSKASCNKIAAMPEFRSAQTLLAYMATAYECDPKTLVEQAWHDGKQVAFPLCISDTELELYVPIEPDAFKVGAYGILEPLPERCRRIEPEELDFIIVPGVAFDAKCQRAGHGAGYYDRLLKNTNAVKVGLAFNEQIAERIPTEATDVAMDYVITEKWTYCKYENFCL